MLNKNFCLLDDGFLLTILDGRLLKFNLKKLLPAVANYFLGTGITLPSDFVKEDEVVQEQKVRLLLRVKEDSGHFDTHIVDPETMLVSAILENQPNAPILNGTAIMKQPLTLVEAKDFISKNPEMWDPVFWKCTGLDLFGHGWRVPFKEPIVLNKKGGRK